MRSLAERIAHLESVLPQSATVADICEAEQLLKEISASDLPIIFSLMLKIGSFYLECKGFDLSISIEKAMDYYQKAERIARQEYNIQWIIYSACGVANCLTEKYKLTNDQVCFINSKKIYEELLVQCDAKGMIEVANSIRINYSRSLQNYKHGDRFSNYDKAIILLRQVLASSSKVIVGEKFNSAVYGRTLYNLGVALSKQSEDPHTRTLYINEAVDCFQKALLFRLADEDPIGRAKVLRALATVLPDWVGAESLAHANQLAQEANAEASVLETTRKAPQRAGWAIAKETTSALYWSLDILNSVAQNRDNIISAIEQHVLNINQILPDQQPLLWAEWLGGYAVLIGRIGIEDSNWKYINVSKSAFANAIKAIPENTDPYLRMALFRELGKIAHQAADWEGSLHANKGAVEIGLNLADNAGTDISRTNELESFTRAVHFATYAAAQLNLGKEAAELAEIGRARWMDEAMIISSIRLSSIAPKIKSEIDEMQASILELERQEHELLNQGLSGLGRRLENYGGLPFGDQLKMRIIADPDGIDRQRSDKLANFRVRIQELHEGMNLKLNSIGDDEIISKRPTYSEIQKIVKAVGFPIVYLLSSTWGSIAIFVSKDVEIISIPELRREQLQGLLYAENGYINNVRNNNDKLELSLGHIQRMLDEHIIPPLISWCKQNEIESIGIIGLGDIGMLPIQVSTVPAELSIHLLPSARALNVSLPHKKENDFSKRKLFTIRDINATGFPPLKYSGIESLVFSDSFRSGGALVAAYSDEMTFDSIDSEINNATHVHLSCHGSFAPFSPLNSVLHLNGDEKFPIENLLRPALKLSGTELVILSACNSASIEHWRTPDETIGFPAAFMAAGAKTVIAAQWPVSDSATFLLMQQFCKELVHNKLDASRSLSKAQMWLQKAAKQEINAAIMQIYDSLPNNEMRAKRLLNELHANIESLNEDYPFKDRKYWAGFVCVGA